MRDWAQHLRPRIASLKLSPVREAEIVEEMAQHLDERYEELRRSGRGEEEAERAALAELSDSQLFARQMRALRQSHVPESPALGARTGSLWRDAWQDVRHSVRTVTKQSAF